MSKEELKKAVGIEKANCMMCKHLDSDPGGGEMQSEHWVSCRKREHCSNLKSFPFKKEMECWEPEFWKSKFAEMIEEGTDKEVESAIEKFADTVREVEVVRT